MGSDTEPGVPNMQRRHTPLSIVTPGGGPAAAGAPPLLRVTLLRTEAEVEGKYFVQLRLAPSESENGSPGTPKIQHTGSHLTGTWARTETSRLSRTPEFMNSSFVLHLPAKAPLNGVSAPGGEGSSAVAMLHANLMAIPSIDHPPRPLQPDGTEQPEVVGTCTVPVTVEMAGRLAQGQCVSQSLLLQGDTQPFSAGSASARLQVELQLLDSTPVLVPQTPTPGPTYVRPPSSLPGTAQTLPFSPSTDPFIRGFSCASSRTPSGGAAPHRRCKLRVLISRAENLPEVSNLEGVRKAPSVFVAAKTTREAAARAPATCVTSVIPNTRNPVWDEVLDIHFRESCMPKERLLLALVNKQTSKLLYKLGIPVGQMQAGRHYNLALRLGKKQAVDRNGEQQTPQPKIYVTLCLTSFVADDIARYEALVQQPMMRVQASLGTTSVDFTSDGGSEVAGVWKLVGDSSAAEEPPTFALGPPRPVFREVVAEATDEVATAIRDMGSSEGRGPGEVAEDALPLLGGKPDAGRHRPLWGAEPGSDEALLVAGAATAASVDPAIVLELHSLWRSNDANTSSSTSGVKAVVGNDEPEVVQESLGDDDDDVVVMGHQSSPHHQQRSIIPVVERTQGEGDGPPLPTPEVAAAHDEALRSARFGPPPGSREAEAMASGATLLGRVVIRLDTLPKKFSGEPFTLHNLPILHFTGPVQDGVTPTCTLHLRLWHLENYMSFLREQSAAPPDEAAAPATPVGANWMGFLDAGEYSAAQQQAAAQSRPSRDGRAVATSASRDGVVRDLLLKQSLLNTLQHEVDRSSAAAEQAGWRLTSAEKKINNLRCDIAQLEALLQAEREAAAAAAEADGQPLSGGGADEDFAAMPIEEAAARARALKKALVREQRRAADLEAQLQRLHSSTVERKEMKRRFKELQEAHAQQGEQLRGLEREAQRVPQYLLAIKSQESVIARMEAMLKESVKERQEVQTLRAEVSRLTATNKELRSIRGSGEVDELQSRLSQAVESEADVRRQQTEDAQERVRAMMRAEKAEAQCTALNEELMESTRRYARQISSLKAQLMEKDAQLMGGFGPLSNIMLGGDLSPSSPSPVSPASTGGRPNRGSSGLLRDGSGWQRSPAAAAEAITDHHLSPASVSSQQRASSPAMLENGLSSHHSPLLGGTRASNNNDLYRSSPSTPSGHRTLNASNSRVLAPLASRGGASTPPAGASPSSSRRPPTLSASAPRQPSTGKLPNSGSPRPISRANTQSPQQFHRDASFGPSQTEPGGRPASRGSSRAAASGQHALSSYPSSPQRGRRRNAEPNLGEAVAGRGAGQQQLRPSSRQGRPLHAAEPNGRLLSGNSNGGSPLTRSREAAPHHRLTASPAGALNDGGRRAAVGMTGGEPPRSKTTAEQRPPANPTSSRAQPTMTSAAKSYQGGQRDGGVGGKMGGVQRSDRSFSTASDEEMGAAAERMLSLAKTEDFIDTHRSPAASESETSDYEEDYSDGVDYYSEDDESTQPTSAPRFLAAAPRVAAT